VDRALGRSRRLRGHPGDRVRGRGGEVRALNRRPSISRSHSEAELRGWAKSLRIFRYCESVGGHANDGDELLAAIRCERLTDTGQILHALGLDDVGHQQLAGVPCFLFAAGGLLTISTAGADGDPYRVTQRAMWTAQSSSSRC
jgi:hypothetical protein